MDANKMKWGYGPSSNIATAVADGMLDARDMVVTSDTDELVHIQSNGDLQYIKSRIAVFESAEAAEAAITASGNHHYLGEPIAIKNSGGGYELCTVGSGEGGSFIAIPVADSAEAIQWIDF